MKKLKFYLGPVLLILLIFAIFWQNKDSPRDIKINSYKLNEEVIYDNLGIKAKNYEPVDLGSSMALKVTYTLTNKFDENRDASTYLYSITLFHGLENSVGQNFIPPGDFPKEMLNEYFDIYYDDEDFILDPNESKDVSIYYIISKDYFTNERPLNLVFSNSLYWDKYLEYLDKGIFYYEIIDLGASK
ncbi:MAG: hypothetical protein Q4D88_00735 [Anaerococcus sp.]|nr:hypothetical protein [Anaerococcus sp.]